LSNVSAHFEKVREDLVRAIPTSDFSGIGVLDWEGWRPVWERNYDTKSIYTKRSKRLVRKKHPDWSEEKVTAEAKKHFETAGRCCIFYLVGYSSCQMI